MTRFLLCIFLICSSYTFTQENIAYCWAPNGLNIRTSPWNKASVAGRIFMNSKVIILDTVYSEFYTDTLNKGYKLPICISGYWLSVQCGDISGYVFSGYLSHTKPQTFHQYFEGIKPTINTGANFEERTYVRKDKSTYVLLNKDGCLTSTYFIKGATFNDVLMLVNTTEVKETYDYKCNLTLTKREGNKYYFSDCDASHNKTLEVTADGIIYSTSECNKDWLSSSFDKINPQFQVNLMSEELAKHESLYSYIHGKCIPKLNANHRDYFKSGKYWLLYSARGDLFLNKKEDIAFIAYNRENKRISILLYNDLDKKYGELYYDIQVENRIEFANCNYGYSGTLDNIIANNILYNIKNVSEKPDDFFQYELCKVTRIQGDETFILEEGCFTSQAIPEYFLSCNSLCIATSYVYNNWDCLKYDPVRKVFTIFYGQGFAD